VDYDTVGEGLHVAVCRENRMISNDGALTEINAVLEIIGTKITDD